MEISASPVYEKISRRRLKAIFGGSIGNLVEWYDWYVYSTFALYFSSSFFPKGNNFRFLRIRTVATEKFALQFYYGNYNP